MSNTENRSNLREKYERKPSGMQGMSEGYDAYMLNVTRICTKSWEAVTSRHIARNQKSSSISYESNVPDLTHIYVKNMGNSAQDEEVADPLSLMKHLTLNGQAKFF